MKYLGFVGCRQTSGQPVLPQAVPPSSTLQLWSPTGRSLPSTKCVRSKLFNNTNDLSRYTAWAVQAPSMRKTIRVRPLPLLSWSFMEWACHCGLKCNLDACFLFFFFLKWALQDFIHENAHSWPPLVETEISCYLSFFFVFTGDENEGWFKCLKFRTLGYLNKNSQG